jgi:hypothetical protein
MPRVLPSAALVLAAASVASACASSEPPQAIALVHLTQAGCRQWDGQPVGRVCLPRSAREGVKLMLEAAGTCAGCGTVPERCTVSVDGRTVTLSLDGRTCGDDATGARAEAANATCACPKLTCAIPPLEAGRYAVRFEDGSDRTNVLEVVPDATAATACSL